MNLGSLLLGIFAFIVLLSVIIIIHELGHLMTAKKFGVYCHEFSIGWDLVYGRINLRKLRCHCAQCLLAVMS